MKKHIGYSCKCNHIYYTTKEAPNGICPKCGKKMLKAYSLTYEEIDALEEQAREIREKIIKRDHKLLDMLNTGSKKTHSSQ